MSDPKGAARFFDRFADDFDRLYDGRRGPLMRAFDRRFRSDMFIRYRWAFEWLGDIEGRTILDVGCGSGPYVLEALRRGAARVTALDPAQRMLELTRQKVRSAGWEQRLSVLQGLFPQVRPPEPHDVALVMGVFDYVGDVPAFLSALRRTVRRGAVASFPSRHWFRTPLRRVRYRLRRCPVFFYDADQVRALAGEAGFAACRIEKIPGAGMDYVAWLGA